MKKNIIIAIIITAALLTWYYWPSLRGLAPTDLPPSEDITDLLPHTGGESVPGENRTDIPLAVPDGFAIEIFANNLPSVRDIVIDGLGNMWVSQLAEGKVSLLEIGENGAVTHQSAVFTKLNHPHGLAVDPGDGLTLYIAEEDKISRVRLYSEGQPEKIADLPPGDRHYTRSLGFGPDGRLYVSIGSTCDTCIEEDTRHAAIYSMNADGSDFRSFATGLRNSVFFTWSYVDGRMWATEMGRDGLGDDVPPDEINIIGGPSTHSTTSQGGEQSRTTHSGQNPVVPDFGWPICYGNNIHDTDFDKNVYIQDPCNDKIPPAVELQAHSAPLGLAFVPEEGWPEAYWYNLIVAYHGSWNRTEPTGYKLVRIKLDDKGNYQGTEDFLTGWLPSGSNSALGRPVDVLALPGGIMYVSDDSAGVIYKIFRLTES